MLCYGGEQAFCRCSINWLVTCRFTLDECSVTTKMDTTMPVTASSRDTTENLSPRWKLSKYAHSRSTTVCPRVRLLTRVRNWGTSFGAI